MIKERDEKDLSSVASVIYDGLRPLRNYFVLADKQAFLSGIKKLVDADQYQVNIVELTGHSWANFRALASSVENYQAMSGPAGVSVADATGSIVSTKPVVYPVVNEGLKRGLGANLSQSEKDCHFFSERLMPLIQSRSNGVLIESLVEPNVDSENKINASEYEDKDASPNALHVICQLSQNKIGWVTFYRMNGRPTFSQRDEAVAKAITGNSQWIFERHAKGSNGDIVNKLAPRERQVLVLLLEGKSKAEIAAELGLSGFTIGDYFKSLYRHFDTSSRAELQARFFMKHH
jgi:DNA-binding CsgD family transcriptional regulator